MSQGSHFLFTSRGLSLVIGRGEDRWFLRDISIVVSLPLPETINPVPEVEQAGLSLKMSDALLGLGAGCWHLLIVERLFPPAESREGVNTFNLISPPPSLSGGCHSFRSQCPYFNC